MDANESISFALSGISLSLLSQNCYLLSGLDSGLVIELLGRAPPIALSHDTGAKRGGAQEGPARVSLSTEMASNFEIWHEILKALGDHSDLLCL